MSRATMRINGRVICGNRSQTWELSNVPIEISTILDEFHVSRVQWPDCKAVYTVSCAITVVTYAYSEGDVSSRRCLLGSRLWTGLTATVEKKLWRSHSPPPPPRRPHKMRPSYHRHLSSCSYWNRLQKRSESLNDGTPCPYQPDWTPWTHRLPRPRQPSPCRLVCCLTLLCLQVLP